MDKAQFIKQELARLPLVTFDDKQAKILCPFHADHNPSLDVSLIKIVKNRGGQIKEFAVGSFSCWSCGAHGGWNKLAEKLGLSTWGKEEATSAIEKPRNSFDLFSHDLTSLTEQFLYQGYKKPVTEGPWKGAWRELSGSFLRNHGAEILWDKVDEAYRIYLPLIDLTGEIVGHIAARPDNSPIPDKRKYINSLHFPAKKYWYCLNYEINPKTVVIVEGPYDTLRFRSRGIPAIGALGVNQISDEKIMQIIAQGCRKVVLALDADEAGRQATVVFNQEFKKWGFEIIDLNLTQYCKTPTDKIDPGNCPEEAIQDLKSYLGI